MITIETKNPVYNIDGQDVARLEVGTIGFLSFCEVGAKAGSASKNDSDVQKNLFRERIKRQVKAFDAAGKEIPLSDVAILSMPLPYAMRLKKDINADPVGEMKSCEMLSKGDGMLSPIHIKLGFPLKGSAGKEIAELEFQAQTLGQLEDFVAAGTDFEKTTALLKVARPVGEDMTLLALPSWALDQIALTDGAWIMENVVPSFLFEQKTS